MNPLKRIAELLQKIRYSAGSMQAHHITVLQQFIWDGIEVQDEWLQELLTNLASDLNFYESDERDRDEALGYYGEEGLLQRISEVEEKLKTWPDHPAS